MSCLERFKGGVRKLSKPKPTEPKEDKIIQSEWKEYRKACERLQKRLAKLEKEKRELDKKFAKRNEDKNAKDDAFVQKMWEAYQRQLERYHKDVEAHRQWAERLKQQHHTLIGQFTGRGQDAAGGKGSSPTTPGAPNEWGWADYSRPQNYGVKGDTWGSPLLSRTMSSAIQAHNHEEMLLNRADGLLWAPQWPWFVRGPGDVIR